MKVHPKFLYRHLSQAKKTTMREDCHTCAHARTGPARAHTSRHFQTTMSRTKRKKERKRRLWGSDGSPLSSQEAAEVRVIPRHQLLWGHSNSILFTHHQVCTHRQTAKTRWEKRPRHSQNTEGSFSSSCLASSGSPWLFCGGTTEKSDQNFGLGDAVSVFFKSTK